ncbi:MAG: tRNA 2-thiouridine(34) synthase MnmA [Planctomycetota bacterium]
MVNARVLPRLLPPTFNPWRPADPDRAVAVLMSGGVDSSVTALLLKQEGWDAVGVTMRIPMADGCRSPRPCCGWEAATVCSRIGLPHYFIDTAESFEARVVIPFRDAYARGATPNPCMDCNTSLKFDLVWDALEREWGPCRVATGHYARIVGAGPTARLARAADPQRDQSYFLYGIPPGRLPRVLFPLGDRRKDAVRRLAHAAGLPTAERPDSMDLCFAGEGDYRSALGPGSIPAEGPILDESGRELGRHNGIGNFTPGQRQGLGIAAREPLYVLRIDAARNAVIVGLREAALVSVVCAGEVRVLVTPPPAADTPMLGRIRSQGDYAPCRVEACGPGGLRVRFDRPVFAPAPGQHLVVYDTDGTVAAGGVIRAEQADHAAGDWTGGRPKSLSENLSVGPRPCEGGKPAPTTGRKERAQAPGDASLRRSWGRGPAGEPGKETEAGYAESRAHNRCRATPPGAAAAGRSQERFSDGL